MNFHYRPRIYTASKLHKASLWISLRREWTGIEFTARWSDLVGRVDDSSDKAARTFWLHDIEDVKKSDSLLLLADPEDKLRGALVEAGVALGLGKHVMVVGSHPDFGSWHNHPLVSHAESVTEGLERLAGPWNSEIIR